MVHLLHANLHALLRAKRFWLSAFILTAGAAWDAIAQRGMASLNGGALLDNTIVNCAAWQFILLPCLCGLFINTDYHDGTIRCKLTVGRSRTAVYLSNFITVYAMELFFMALSVSAVLIAGAGLTIGNPGNVVLRLAVLLMLFLALTAICVFAAMLIANRSALVVCAMVGLGLMFGGQAICLSLESPKVIPNYGSVIMTTNEDGEQTMQYLDREGNPISVDDIPMIPNPSYIDEPLQSVLRTANNIQPGGQLWEILWDGHRVFSDDGAQVETIEQTPRWQLALYSAAVTLFFLGLGLTLFRRKDLK